MPGLHGPPSAQVKDIKALWDQQHALETGEHQLYFSTCIPSSACTCLCMVPETGGRLTSQLLWNMASFSSSKTSGLRYHDEGGVLACALAYNLMYGPINDVKMLPYWR